MNSDHVSLLSKGIDIHTRTMVLNGPVDDDLLIQAQLGYLILGPGPITMQLTTFGGEVYAGLGIYDLIKAHGRTTIHVVGYAMSMGGIILQAGEKRVMSENSTLMLHWGYQAAEDTNPDNYKLQLKQQEKMDKLCNQLILKRVQEKHPKKKMAWLVNKTKNDWYLTSQEAIELGLLDEAGVKA